MFKEALFVGFLFDKIVVKTSKNRIAALKHPTNNSHKKTGKLSVPVSSICCN